MKIRKGRKNFLEVMIISHSHQSIYKKKFWNSNILHQCDIFSLLWILMEAVS